MIKFTWNKQNCILSTYVKRIKPNVCTIYLICTRTIYVIIYMRHLDTWDTLIKQTSLYIYTMYTGINVLLRLIR